MNRPYNTELFREYLVELFQTFRANRINNAVIIADNVAFHRNQEIQILARANGHQLIFLPAYSPFLNPIEELFGQ